jgi:hypothetical protein
VFTRRISKRFAVAVLRSKHFKKKEQFAPVRIVSMLLQSVVGVEVDQAKLL